MDVHAPHEPIHTWKDFLLHLATITIGLFIALSLEGLVDYMHHRHLLREARENIRQEIEDNHKAAQKDIVSVQKDIDITNADIDTVRRMRADPKSFKGSLSYSIQFSSLSDAAWNSARDTVRSASCPTKRCRDTPISMKTRRW